jgi:hypothetical protein
MNKLFLPTENGGQTAIYARIPGTARNSTRKVGLWGTYH